MVDTPKRTHSPALDAATPGRPGHASALQLPFARRRRRQRAHHAETQVRPAVGEAIGVQATGGFGSMPTAIYPVGFPTPPASSAGGRSTLSFPAPRGSSTAAGSVADPGVVFALPGQSSAITTTAESPRRVAAGKVPGPSATAGPGQNLAATSSAIVPACADPRPGVPGAPLRVAPTSRAAARSAIRR